MKLFAIAPPPFYCMLKVCSLFFFFFFLSVSEISVHPWFMREGGREERIV